MSKRARSALGGPKRVVVYIFKREGMRGAALWLLVLECGHPVIRNRSDPKSWSALAQAMFRPLREKLAPQRAQCHRCGAGETPCDPVPLIRALGGEI